MRSHIRHIVKTLNDTLCPIRYSVTRTGLTNRHLGDFRINVYLTDGSVSVFAGRKALFWECRVGDKKVVFIEKELEAALDRLATLRSVDNKSVA